MNKYFLTDEELAELKEASKPVPYMVFGGIEPESPRDKAMRIWERVAKRVGCRVDTIGPASGGSQNEFRAEPL